MTAAELLSLVQVFLLAMIVIGMAIKEVSQETNNDSMASNGFAMFVGLLGGWIVITAIVIAALIAIVFGGLWFLAYASQALASL